MSFECGICQKVLLHFRSLKEHMYTHTAEKPYTCSSCGRCYSTRGGLQYHVRTSHSEISGKSHQCEVCQKVFPYLYALKMHQLSHTNEKPFACDECGQKYVRKYHLNFHKRKCHSKEKLKLPYKCFLCPKAFLYPGELRLHVIKHTIDKPFACIECDKKYGSTSRLRKHIKIAHSKEKPEVSNTILHKCEICSDTFEMASKLRVHLRTHEKPYACSECSKRFKVDCYLRHHMRKAHAKLMPFTCEICSRTFPLSSRLKQHQLSHSKEKTFACDKCDKKYIQKRHLRVHYLKKHVESVGPKKVENPFVCNQCGVRYSVMRSLKVHVEKVHSENNSSNIILDRTFKCDLCEKVYSQKHHLRQHQRTSHGNKNAYPCTECDKKYSLKESLEFHIRKVHCKEDSNNLDHSSVKKFYECFACSNMYSCISKLKRHLVTHTGEKPYACDECEEKYAYKESLRQHKFKVHSKKEL